MPPPLAENWITSKEILLKSGISRATLNNYIKMGILPKPVVHKPQEDMQSTKKIGYFPNAVLERIDLIKKLKQSGYSMENIIQELANKPMKPASWDSNDLNPPGFDESFEKEQRKIPIDTPFLRLTFENIQSPAYVMNYGFEVIWVNTLAERHIFRQRVSQIGVKDERNIFRLFFHWDFHARLKNWRDLMRYHMSFAKLKYAKSWMKNLYAGISQSEVEILEGIYDEVQVFPHSALGATSFQMMMRDGEVEDYRVYHFFCQEGIFFVYVHERRMPHLDHGILAGV